MSPAPACQQVISGYAASGSNDIVYCGDPATYRPGIGSWLCDVHYEYVLRTLSALWGAIYERKEH